MYVAIWTPLQKHKFPFPALCEEHPSAKANPEATQLGNAEEFPADFAATHRRG
jgi:hypothetical protein